MELTTNRLWLRPYQQTDWQTIHVYASDLEVCQHQAWGPNTEQQTQEFVAHCINENEQPAEERVAYHFAVVLRESHTLLGGCTLRVTNPALQEAMIGYTLDRHYWNQGYTTEVARALLRLGFSTLGLHRVMSWCTPENIGSWRVMEKAGMRREGHEREAAFFKGQWHDWFRYAILNQEWQNQPDVLS